jgi:hypothetical protein
MEQEVNSFTVVAANNYGIKMMIFALRNYHAKTQSKLRRQGSTIVNYQLGVAQIRNN